MFGWFCVVLIIINVATLAQAGKCDAAYHGHVPRSVYNDLRCTPVPSDLSPNCPIKYDCSNIYDRPKNTCHFQGKSYKIGESINEEELSGVWDTGCTCREDLNFECNDVQDGCAEDWVGDYPKFGCYLKYELHSYCAAGQICEPFDDNAKCEVKGVTYREGDKFPHPDERCEQCVCGKGFTGKFEPPFCQPVNCTTEIKHSKNIDDHCAPYYGAFSADTCCPKTWVCPSKTGKFTPSPVGTPSYQPASEFSCQFGDHVMHIGDYYEDEDKDLGSIYCQCDVPPFATCKKPAEPIILNK